MQAGDGNASVTVVMWHSRPRLCRTACPHLHRPFNFAQDKRGRLCHTRRPMQDSDRDRGNTGDESVRGAGHNARGGTSARADPTPAWEQRLHGKGRARYGASPAQADARPEQAGIIMYGVPGCLSPDVTDVTDVIVSYSTGTGAKRTSCARRRRA